MNKELWKKISDFVSLEEYPFLPCPYCKVNDLKFDIDSIQYRPISDNYNRVAPSRHYLSVENEKLQEQEKNGEMLRDAWEENRLLGALLGIGSFLNEVLKPNYTFQKFNAFMVCQNCGDYVSVNGLSQVHKPKTQQEVKLPSIFKVEHFSTPVSMFDVNESVPVSIQFELYGAFSYYHVDTNSSANKLRRAMEQFCRELNAKGGNLSRMIQDLKSTFPFEADMLDTLRLVGNEGTHSDGVNEDDLLTAFQIFEEVLDLFRRKKVLANLQSSQKQLTDKFDRKENGSN